MRSAVTALCSPRRRSWSLGCLAVLALSTLAACQPEIGDPCKRSLDCGTQVVRQCDVSNALRDPKREGECTLENCSYGVCPKEAICIKVYASQFQSVACDPDLEDVYGADGEVERNDCQPHEICMPEGLCGDELRARTSCRRKCDSDSDCRSNYQCKRTGSEGVYVAPDPDDPTLLRSAKICVPE